MTDNEIKALECLCGQALKCKECPYSPRYSFPSCQRQVAKDTIVLITRQQAEIERLTRELNLVCENSITARLPHCVLCGDDVAVLTQDLKGYDEFIADVSAESVKKFAERLKENLSDCHIVSDEGEYVGYDCADVTHCIDNLVKEMVVKTMPKYRVECGALVTRLMQRKFIVSADNEEEAKDKAEFLFDKAIGNLKTYTEKGATVNIDLIERLD